MLFKLPELSTPGAPVLTGGRHTDFVPTWQLLRAIVREETVTHVSVTVGLPGLMASKDSINFNYLLAGGNIMNLVTDSLAS